MESLLLKRLSVLSHASRMAVFQLLVRRCPDAVPAGEIATALDLKASTSSVYLAALSGCGLITQKRRGTSLLYAVDLQAAQDVISELFLGCCNGRPDLCPTTVRHPLERASPRPDTRYNILFVCTGNSARSIFAEAIMRHEGGDRFNVYSAGTAPNPGPNPIAIELLQSMGIETGHLRAKDIAEFRVRGAPKMDFVFTVCDQAANEECAAWDGQPIAAHWGLPDPTRIDRTQAEKQLAFQQTFEAMHMRIAAFSALPLDQLSRASVQREVDAIGRNKELT